VTRSVPVEIGIAAAARNNAVWCDAVCSAHGHPGEFFDSHWRTREPTPPGYPSLVTLDASLRAMAAVDELGEVRAGAAWAVKDSFAVLPLEGADFRLHFEAQWIVCPAPLERATPRSPGTPWRRIRSAPELAAWEAAWGESPGQPRVFLPPLLDRSDIAILALPDSNGSFRAGIVANRTEHAVGVSNFFSKEEESQALRAAGVDAATDAFPGLPVVGYEAGSDLAECRALGFDSLGSLRVWLREAPMRGRPS
jgi:hypothetical protein